MAMMEAALGAGHYDKTYEGIHYAPLGKPNPTKLLIEIIFGSGTTILSTSTLASVCQKGEYL